MRPFLLDADAFLAMRSLSILSLLRQATQLHDGPMLMTHFIARHELHQVASVLEELVQEGVLEIQSSIPLKTEMGQTWLALRQQRGTHKGEAEAIAWALSFPKDERPLFVSCDQRARRTAEKNGVPSTDVLGLVIEAVEGDLFNREDAEIRLRMWDDRQQQLCRPSDFTNFEETYERRLTQLRIKD